MGRHAVVVNVICAMLGNVISMIMLLPLQETAEPKRNMLIMFSVMFIFWVFTIMASACWRDRECCFARKSLRRTDTDDFESAEDSDGEEEKQTEIIEI